MAHLEHEVYNKQYGVYEIVATGILSKTDQPALDTHVRQASFNGAIIVALACYGITFLHKDGADLLFATQKSLAQQGRQFYLIGPSPAIKHRLSRLVMTSSFQEKPSLSALLQELEHNVN